MGTGAVSVLVIAFLCIVLTFSFAYSQNVSQIHNTSEPESLDSDNITGVSTINPDRVQIFLRNDTTRISDIDERTYEIIVPIITALGAIGGAILGTYFTGRHAMKLEEKRIKEQHRKEDELHQRIRQLVHVDLYWISEMLSSLERPDLDEKAKSRLRTPMNVERQYPRLPIETKVSSYTPEALGSIEAAYQLFNGCAELFRVTFPSFERREITLEELREKLSLKATKNAVDEAEKLLKVDAEKK